MNKKITLSILILLSLVFTSCVNFFSNELIETDDSAGIYVINGNYSFNNNSSARTAIPNPDLSLYTFEVIAESLATPPAASVNGVVDSVNYSYSIELTDGDWKLTINGYKDAAKTQKVLTAENLVTIGNYGVASGSIHFTLKMIQTPALGANAEVLLPVEVDSVISRVEASWKESGVEKKQTIIQNSAATTGNFTMIDDGETTLTATNGAYDVVFRFYKKLGTTEVIAYSLIEKINLYDYLTTNKWLANAASPFYSTGKLKITSSILKTYEQTIFYVSSTGSDTTNSGGFFDPFATPQPAVEIIQSKGDWDEEYTIYIIGTVTMPPASTGVDGSMVCIGDSADSTVAPKITILGYEALNPGVLNANGTFTSCRVMTIYNGAKVTLGENLTLKNGTADLGAGIRNFGEITINGTIISDNSASDLGGGLYTSGGTVSLRSGFIQDNTAVNGGEALYTAASNVTFSGGAINNSIYVEGITSAGAGKLDFMGNVHIAGLIQFGFKPDGYVPVSIYSLVNSTQTLKAAFVPATGKTYSDLIGTVFFKGKNAGDSFAYANNVTVCNMDGTTAAGYTINSNGKLAVPTALGPNGGNASSEYTVISTLSEMIASGSATAGVYSISTYDEMKQLSTFAVTSNCSGYTFVLYDNIIMDDSENFTPIGNSSKKFAGTFDGNGNKITKLNVNVASGNAGLFGSCNKATIKNVYVEGTVTSSVSTVGGIVGSLETTGVIDNCVSNVKVTSTSVTGNCIGGICGNSKAKITNCINLGEISGTGSSSSNVGGITGYAENSIFNCANFGKVSGNSGIGGITGKLVNGKTIGNSYNYGKVVCSPSVTEGSGAIEGNGQSGNEENYSNVYYHANSGVSCAVPKSTYTSVGTTFTDPEALRTLLNSNIYSYILAAPECKNWDKSITIGGVNFPVPVDFDLSELAGIMLSLSSISEVPSNKYVTYTLTETADFAKLASWVNAGNTFEDFSFVIPPETPEIHLSGTFTPIGTDSDPFMGTFDGSNVKISSLALEDNASSWNVSMFGDVKNAVIKNVKLEGSVSSSSLSGRGGYAGLVGAAKGNVVIDNCDVLVVVQASNQNNVGGIVAWYDDDLQEDSCLQIRNCINRGSIASKGRAGGILGVAALRSKGCSVIIENCVNYGGVTVTSEIAGGIVGQIRYYSGIKENCSATISNCFSNATGGISGTGYLGNIVGQEEAASIQTLINNCYYHTTSAGESKYEGTSNATITDCNTFRTMNTKYQVYDSGNYFDGTPYTVDTDLIDIVNNWVTGKNTGSSTYRSWKYESSQLVFE